MIRKYKLELPVTISPQCFIRLMSTLFEALPLYEKEGRVILRVESDTTGWANFIRAFNKWIEKSYFKLDLERHEKLRKLVDMYSDCFEELPSIWLPKKDWRD